MILGMTLVCVQVDPRLKQAVMNLAWKEHRSLSAVIREMLEKYMEDRGINWREME